MAAVRSTGILPGFNPLIMPGIDPPGKRFYITLNQKDRALTSPHCRN
jgi:hypothetical protein